MLGSAGKTDAGADCFAGETSMLSTVELILRLGLAAGCGAILGWEREAQHKPAGLRTHILVALGSAAFMLAGLELHLELVAKNQASNADLLKVLGGIAGGVGFLGAGSIIHSRSNISGLTTAATTWLSAAVGIACALGYYRLAGITVGLGLIALLALGLIEPGKHYLQADERPAEDEPASKANGSSSGEDDR
jgi:putative Mg2+ transporter-C (MgtC) family protein